jgi:hypothetical protein
VGGELPFAICNFVDVSPPEADLDTSAARIGASRRLPSFLDHPGPAVAFPQVLCVFGSGLGRHFQKPRSKPRARPFERTGHDRCASSAWPVCPKAATKRQCGTRVRPSKIASASSRAAIQASILLEGKLYGYVFVLHGWLAIC